MKTIVVFACMGIGAISATATYAERRRHAAASDIDRRATAMAGIERLLPAGARVSFACPNNNAVAYATCRYVLAPVYLSFTPGEHFDTALTLLAADAPDSMVLAITTNRKVLWQNADSTYRYYLTSKP